MVSSHPHIDTYYVSRYIQIEEGLNIRIYIYIYIFTYAYIHIYIYISTYLYNIDEHAYKKGYFAATLRISCMCSTLQGRTGVAELHPKLWKHWTGLLSQER